MIFLTPNVSYQVQRNGKIIGTYDERTLRALLNAGTLRVTDSYQVEDGDQQGLLADLLGNRKHRRLILAIIVICFVTLGVEVVLLTSAKPVTESVRLIQAGGQRTTEGEEIQRGYPVLRRSISVSHHQTPQFPFAEVNSRAARGRVSVTALDDQEVPLRVGSGFVTEDGTHVVAALALVQGAAAAQIWFSPEKSIRVKTLIPDADHGLAVFVLNEPKVGYLWARSAPSSGEEVFISGHALQPLPMVAEVFSTPESAKEGFYHLGGALPSSYLGGAVLNSAGQVCGIVTDASEGGLVSLHGVPSAWSQHPAVPLSTLKGIVFSERSSVVVDSAKIQEGQLLLEMRNASATPINHAILFVRYYEMPPKAEEIERLEQRLTALAVETCSLELDDPESERCFQSKLQLRRVTDELEQRRHSVAAALGEARQKVRRTDLLAIDAELPPNLPQQVTLETNAASNWGAVVTVVDSLE